MGIGIFLLIGIVVYYLLDPSTNSLFPKCPFYYLTGFKCPGCGSQRAIHSLLHLNIGQAFRYNALLVLSLPAVVFLSVIEMVRKIYPQLYTKVNNAYTIWGTFTVVVIWWIFRNSLGV